MTLREEIQEQERKLASMRQRLSNCQHLFGEPYQDVEVIREPRFELECRGSDCYPVESGFSEKQTSVWRRKCTICGKIETTTKTVPTAVKPVF